MATLKQFTLNLESRAADIEDKSNNRVAKFCALVHQTVVLATPVDTGRARGNWDVSIGGSSKEPTDNIDQSGSNTIARGRAVAESRKPGQSVHIANNLPYIAKLNEGSSAQAPKLFVEQAIDEVSAHFKGRPL